MAARKKTSDRVSSIAGRILADLRTVPADIGDNVASAFFVTTTLGELRALCASALSQDEVPRKVARGKR